MLYSGKSGYDLNAQDNPVLLLESPAKTDLAPSEIPGDIDKRMKVLKRKVNVSE